MKISKKCQYALRSLIDIGIQHTQGHSLVRISELAHRTNIPEKFLEQILLTLKNSTILKSKRGIDGGYSLVKSPKKINLSELIQIMDGPLIPIGCVSTTEHDPCNCPNEETCGLRLAMIQVQKNLHSILSKYTLEDFIKKTSLLQTKQTKVLQFEI